MANRDDIDPRVQRLEVQRQAQALINELASIHNQASDMNVDRDWNDILVTIIETKENLFREQSSSMDYV